MDKKSTISAVIPVLNAGKHLPRCLESIRWVDQILVLDGGSEDNTREIARAFDAYIVSQPPDLVERHLGNFDIVRNTGFDLASGDWILSLDADEVVPEELKREICEAIRRAPAIPYFIPRENLYWGRPVRLLGEDFQLRLFPKGSVRYEGVELDARPAVCIPPGRLKSRLRHYSIESLFAFFKKLDARTTQRARVRTAQKVPVYPWQPITSLIRTFWRYYIGEAAWKDGATGLAVAALYAVDPCATVLKQYWQCLRALTGVSPRKAR